jgi:CHAT domain-containing protein
VALQAPHTSSPFEVHELIRDVRPRASLVVLGVCEAGRSRRSRSDEPIGFPGLLSGAGVGAVVAPMWPVDDFASMIFLNRLHEDLARGRDAAESVEATASWLRSLDTRSVLDLLAELVLRVRALETRAVRQALESVGPRLDRMRDWLRTLGPRDRPFRAPLDWAAFQVTGIPR